MFKNIFVFALLLILFSCQDTQTVVKKTEKKAAVIKLKKAKPAKSTVQKPIITQKNVISFLTAYGKQHPENNIIIRTRLGDIHIQLYKETPLHRANFLFLINQGYFNTTCFHRVVEDFIIQAGQSDNPKTSALRKKIGHYKIPPEFIKKYKHHKGALSAARRWNENQKKRSDAFEFFIVHKQKGLQHLDGEHTVFGRVTKGLDVVDKISKIAIDKGEWPLNDVYLSLQIN